MAWSWPTYHSQLRRRIEQTPPLMRSVWSPRANRLDWLAASCFPLSVIKKCPTPNYGQLHGVPFRSVNITVREGLPASIFRASLIASLLGHTPAQRRNFFGTSFTDKKHPTVGYLNMRELPPWSSTSEAGSLLSITELMTQSLPYLDTRNVRPAQAPRTSAGPPTSQAEMLAFPNVLVLDGTGFLGGNAHDRLKYLGLFAHASTHLHLVDQLVIITITGDHAFEHLPFSESTLDKRVCIDASSAPEQLRMFLLAWERWCAPHDSPHAVVERARGRFQRMCAALDCLGMTLPQAANSSGQDVLASRHADAIPRNIASFDIACALVAMQRDGEEPRDTEELCRNLRERIPERAVVDIERVLRAYLMARGFLEPGYSLLRDGDRGASLVDVARMHELIGDRFLNFIASNGAEPVAEHEVAQELFFNPDTWKPSMRNLLNIMLENPLLPSMFVLEVDPSTGSETLHLTAERLGLSFLAHEAASTLRRSDRDSLADLLFSYAGCLPPDAWENFIFAVFANLVEQRCAYLVHEALDSLILLLLAIPASGVFAGGKVARRRILGNMLAAYGIRLDPDTLRETAVQEDTALWQRAASEPYVDAVVRASLRYNLRTDGVPPEAWEWWAGCSGAWPESYEFVHPLDAETVTEHIAYLRDLLHEPAPACDNAALVLRAIGEVEAL